MTKRKLQVRKKKEPSKKVRGGRRAKTGHQLYTNASPNPKKCPLCPVNFLFSTAYVTNGSTAELSGSHL